MKARVSLVMIGTVMAVLLTGCFGKIAVPEYGTLKGHIQESPENDVTQLTVKFGSKETNPKADGSFEFPQIETGTYEFTVTEGDQVLYSSTVKLDADENIINLVFGGELQMVNPDFESPVEDDVVPGWRSGWRYRDGVPVLSRSFWEISDEQALSGQYSLKLDATNTQGVETVVVTEPVPAIPGFVYTGSIGYFHDGTGNPNPYIVVSFFNEDGNRIVHSPIVRSGGTEGEWGRVTSSGVAPEGTVSVAVNVAGNTNFLGVTYWDDVKIEVSRPPADSEE